MCFINMDVSHYDWLYAMIIDYDYGRHQWLVYTGGGEWFVTNRD
jgi:hypothetical protein